MKEKIYTIPVNDAFSSECGCPFCCLYERLEQELVEYTLGPSLMQPEHREDSNKTGFCKNHLDMLQKGDNRLGLSLMLSTYTQQILKELENIGNKANEVASRRVFKKDDKIDISKLEVATSSCIICNKLSYTMDRYIDVFFDLWVKEAEFKSQVANSKGFCLTHTSVLLKLSDKFLSGNKYKDFIKSLTSLQIKVLGDEHNRLLNFIDMFDHNKRKNTDMSCKDALSDLILKLRS